MHEFIEVGVTLCVLTARADKIAVEIDVIADDALDRAVRRAVEWGGRTVSKFALTTRSIRHGLPSATMAISGG